MALRRLGGQALRQAAAARAVAVATAPGPTAPLPTMAAARAATARPPSLLLLQPQQQSPPRLHHYHHHHHLNYSTVTTAIAAASAAAAVAKKVAAATAVAAKTAAAARTATTGGAATAVFAKTLLQRAGGALFEAGGARGAVAAGTALVSAAVVRGGTAAAGNGGAAAAAAAAAGGGASSALSASRRSREALLRHASAVDRAFRLSRGRLPGTPFRIWRGLPFARVAARAAHGTALVALSIGHGCPALLTTRLLANLVAESCLRAVPLFGGPLAYAVFEKGVGTGGRTSNIQLLERWAAREEAREVKMEKKAASLSHRLVGMFRPPWRRGVAPATARRRKGWGVLGTARRALMLAGAAGVLALLPAGVAATTVLTGVKWVLAALYDSGFG